MTYWDDTTSVYKTKDYRRLKTTKAFLKVARKGDKVLDVGCATGGFYDVVKHTGITYTGIDITPSSIQCARDMHPGVEFLVGDIRALPFPDNSFEIVVCWDVLVHVTEYKKALKELCRVAKRNLLFTCQLTKSNGDFFGKQGAAPYNIFGMSSFLGFLSKLFPSIRLICEYGYMLPDVDVPDEYKTNLNTIVITDKTCSTPTEIKIRGKFLTLTKSKLHQVWIKLWKKI